jgi:hypothetical protein
METPHLLFNLGVMCRNGGRGAPENDAEAVKWYRMATEQGDADAQFNLSNMYAKGQGVPTNNVKAYMWWSLSKAQGAEDVATNLNIVQKRMTAPDIAKAQALAVEWREKHNN